MWALSGRLDVNIFPLLVSYRVSRWNGEWAWVTECPSSSVCKHFCDPLSGPSTHQSHFNYVFSSHLRGQRCHTFCIHSSSHVPMVLSSAAFCASKLFPSTPTVARRLCLRPKSCRAELSTLIQTWHALHLPHIGQTKLWDLNPLWQWFPTWGPFGGC